MANTYKDIVITPNKGNTSDDPKIVFSGGNTSVNTDITLRVYPTSNGTLSFEGSAGQLFSITNDLTGSIFSVNDISGIPSIDVTANGLVSVAGYSGNLVVGRTTDSTAGLGIKLDVAGSANAIQYYANGTLVTAIANSYATTIVTANVAAANAWANNIGVVANNYASTIIQANVAAANAWTNAVFDFANNKFLANANLGVANNYAYTGNLYVTTGNVIIGQATDSTAGQQVKLDVNGNIKATSFIGNSEVPLNQKVTAGGVAGTIAIAPWGTRDGQQTVTLTANRQYFLPVIIPYYITTSTLAMEVTTAGASSSVRMNLYAADSAGAPTGSPLSTDVLVATSTLGTKTGSYIVTLQPGLYWASMVCNATAPQVRGMRPIGGIGVSTMGATPVYGHIYGTFTFAAMGAYSSVTSITGVDVATASPSIFIY